MQEVSRRQVRISGVRLSYEEYGTGKPLLMVHGFGANTCSWYRVVPRLAESRRVILLDLKGFGYSEKPLGGDYGLPEQARLVEGFIRRLELEELDLIGHSMGGGVVLLTALALQDRPDNPLDRLVLVDSISYAQRFPAFMLLLRLPLLGAISANLAPPWLSVAMVLRLAYHDPERISHEIKQAYARPLGDPGAVPALVQAARQIVPPGNGEIQKSYGRIRNPTLILWGDDDRIVPLRNGERLQREMPDARLEVIGDCGHIPPEEQPAEFLRLIEPFLALD